jgi:adenylate kinase family enzyme
MPHRLTFLIGASGAGKSAVSEKIAAANLPHLIVCHFDRIGIPSERDMIREHGSGEGWQRAKTLEWARVISAQHLSRNDVILDAQVRPSFIEEACGISGISRMAIILLDCSDDVRRARLIERAQPELANEQMTNWARYLRAEMQVRRLPIIDTSKVTIAEVAKQVMQLVRPVSALHLSPTGEVGALARRVRGPSPK